MPITAAGEQRTGTRSGNTIADIGLKEGRSYYSRSRKEAIPINSPILHSIADTAKLLGLSEHYIRKGIKAGTIPYLPVGKKKLIHVPKLKAIIDEESMEQLKNDDV